MRNDRAGKGNEEAQRRSHWSIKIDARYDDGIR